jgi:hypothetical protein
MLMTCCAYIYKQFEGYYLTPMYITFSIKNMQFYQQCCLEHAFYFSFFELQLEEFS